jgi:hypothetical protein
VVSPDFQPMRAREEPVGIYLFRQNPVFTSLHLRYLVHVVPPQQCCVDASDHMDLNSSMSFRDGGYEQLISNGGMFKPACAERDKKQTMIDPLGISDKLVKNHAVLSLSKAF